MNNLVFFLRFRANTISFDESWDNIVLSYCYIVGLGLNCKFIDLLFKRSFIKFIEISLYLNFIALEIISKQTDTLN